MVKNSTLKGVFLVGLGVSCYGMLATFVKMAYQEGYSTAEVSGSQFALGLIALLILNFFKRKNPRTEKIPFSKHQKRQLIIAGTSIGFTSIFYYLSVKYVPVSVAIVLLMQTVWMGVVIEMFLEKKLPSIQKILSVILTLTGTVLATNLFHDNLVMEWEGFFWGLLAAASYSANMYACNRIAIEIPSSQRSLFMLIGGAIIVLLFTLITQNTPFHFSIFLKWGLILSLFGTIIPPLLLNIGFPLTGIGLGSIVSALELPVSVMMAYFLLGEKVLFGQWMGIFIIIAAIVFMNIRLKK